MKDYLLLRWECSDCGLYHSEIRKPGYAKGVWKCIGCGSLLRVKTSCTGMSVSPQYGHSETFQLAEQHGTEAIPVMVGR